MNTFVTFCTVYYSEKLEMDLEIWYDVTDYDPSVGVDWEFEWEALDEDGKDRKDYISAEEHTACEQLIYTDITEGEYDDGL
jgi:hypothetical protein